MRNFPWKFLSPLIILSSNDNILKIFHISLFVLFFFINYDNFNDLVKLNCSKFVKIIEN